MMPSMRAIATMCFNTCSTASLAIVLREEVITHDFQDYDPHCLYFWDNVIDGDVNDCSDTFQLQKYIYCSFGSIGGHHLHLHIPTLHHLPTLKLYPPVSRQQFTSGQADMYSTCLLYGKR
eukprot:2648560-Ditylum_brightwellii.AAC.1